MIQPHGAIAIGSYKESLEAKDEMLWNAMATISIRVAINSFLETLQPTTARLYKSAFNKIFLYRVLSDSINLQSFALINSNSVVDQIKERLPVSEGSKQAYAAAFISFTRYLDRKTEGRIKRAVPNKEHSSKTFFALREKSNKEYLNEYEVRRFLEELRRLSTKYYFIASMQLQGARRAAEVLDLRAEAINWSENFIRFKKVKDGPTEKYITTHFPLHFMNELSHFVTQETDGVGRVFQTKRGTSPTVYDINEKYHLASVKAHINKQITSHVLRVTRITSLRKIGVDAQDVQKLTGHASLDQLSYYDFSDDERNPSRRFHAI